MDSKETKKWYYVLPVVSIGIFILAWVWLSSAENSMIPTPLAILLCYRSWSWTWCRPWLEQNLQCSC